MATRRAFLAGLAAASVPRVAWAETGSPVCLAAGKQGEDFVLHGLSASGESLFQIALPARGHAAAAHPTEAIAVAFARRPGVFALVIDCQTGLTRHWLTPPLGRQFNGHGAFSPAGDLLMTSEVVADGSAGRIGLWETGSFRRIGEWDSHGIGPHEIRCFPDGRLVIANGGIQTDPFDRTKLNLHEMRPNLSLLSPSGVLLEQSQLMPDLRQNSIRHLGLMGQSVAFAMQWQGDEAEPVPQLGLWKLGQAPTLCHPSQGMEFAMKGYAGSLAVSRDGQRIAVTSAPGGRVMTFDSLGVHVSTHDRADVSGVAALGSDFMATDGLGGVWVCTDTALTPLARAATAWDNHLVALT